MATVRSSILRCYVLILLAFVFCSPAFASNEGLSNWEPLSGVWNSGPDGGTGRSFGKEWGLLLSRDWYGDLEFSGRLAVRKTSGKQQSVAIIFRHAGKSESYAVVFDFERSRVYLQENHFGESREALSIKMADPKKSYPLLFRLSVKGAGVTVNLWPEKRSEADGVYLTFQHVGIPEGRVGLGVRNCEIAFSKARIAGQTQSNYSTYVFRCNTQLSKTVSGEPLWQYLDEVGSSLQSRYDMKFTSTQEFEKYKHEALLKLRRSLGLDPWPERAPLNPKTTGVVEGDGYRVEKVIFESQTGFFVNALVYLPRQAKFPAPAIVSTIGHYGDTGFYIWSEQARSIGLARRGYVVLTYDPISQGERDWLGNGSHDIIRKQIVLAGMEATGLMVWDSIRAIDYLLTRPEVDPNQIGVTGVSGGGFNALYTAVLDERVKAVAPAGFATTVEALIKRALAGCCAYVPNLNLCGDYGEIYSLIAPRKVLILGGYMDELSDRILSIYERARNVYALYGAEENIKYFLDPSAGHTYSKPMRLALYRWLDKWLKGDDNPAAARGERDSEDFLVSKESGLLKVFTEARPGKAVIDLAREYLQKNRVRHELPSTPEGAALFQKEMRQRLTELMGDLEPAKLPAVASDDRNTKPGAVRRVLLKTERDLPVPVDTYQPRVGKKRGSLVIYLSINDRNSKVDTAAKTAQRLTASGFAVAVPQVRGSGATAVSDKESVNLYSLALGKHLFSTRIYDLQRVIDFLLAQPEYQGIKLIVWGEGVREGLMALYLAAIDSRVQAVISSGGLISYQNVIDENGVPDFDYYLPGILKYADVPEIIACIAPRPVLISSPVNIHNRVIDLAALQNAYGWAKSVYKILGRSDNLQITHQNLLNAFLEKWNSTIQR